MYIMAIINSIKARSIYKKADRILKTYGSTSCKLMGINSPSFKGFETVDIDKHHEPGSIPRDRMVIKVDGSLVFLVEKNLSFEVVKYIPGNWEKVLNDKDFLN